MNAKIYNGNVQPNHKEYKIWVNDEGIIKTWNGTKWIELSGGNGSEDNNIKIRYYKIADEAIGYVDNYYPANCKCIDMGRIRYYAPSSTSGDIIAFMFLPCYANDAFSNSLEEIYSNDTEFLKNFEEITEEEYYSIPTINFNIAISNTVYVGEDIKDAQYIIKTYECKMGMTFDEWFDSEYNIDNIKPYIENGEVINGRVVSPILNDSGLGCTIYGYSGFTIDFKNPIADYFYDRNVNTPNGQETCQLIITY